MSFVYKVTLTPIDSFYFGAEESFSSAKIKSIKSDDKSALDYFKKRQGYFAKGEMFPQQTQLLGMLRKEILRLNKKLLYFKNFIKVPKSEKTNAKNLVGDSVWNKNEKLNLGAIKKLSPLFIEQKDSKQLYVPLPKDHGLTLEENKGVSYINGIPKDYAYYFKKSDGKPFGAKDYLCSSYINQNGDLLEIGKIFKEHIRTHTQTLGYKEDNEEQLFKVKRFTLDENYHFVFYLKLSEEIIEDNTETIVTIGGEGSYFNMLMQKQKGANFPTYENHYNHTKSKDTRVVLLSDSYIDTDDKIFEKCKVALAQKSVFRTINNRYEKGDKKHHFDKTQKVILLSKGSVFYPNSEADLEAIEKTLKKPNFQTIGYNKFITIKGEEK